jgi:predicted transglutaminase-like cysteine proteinase
LLTARLLRSNWGGETALKWLKMMLRSEYLPRHRLVTASPHGRLRARWLISALLILLGMPFGPPAVAAYGAAATQPGLFGSREVRSDKLSLFPKWRGALSRHFDEHKLADAPCTATTFNRCHLREWKSFLDSLRGSSRLAQIETVNHYLNKRRYILDPRNYGVPDYWASPHQFLSRDGDCEDYAIAKYFSLRSLGIKAENMRIVVLQDLNLQTAHAILVVYLDGRALVLDNQVSTVVEARAILHYRAIYSINEQHWWLHRL